MQGFVAYPTLASRSQMFTPNRHRPFSVYQVPKVTVTRGEFFMASPNQGAPEQRPVLSKVEARQGVTGQNVRYVLWFSLAGVIVVFAAIYLFYFLGR
jgi:hypothetical protein